MHDLERDKLIIHLPDPTDEEEGGVAAVDDLRVYFSPPAPVLASNLYPSHLPFHVTTRDEEAEGRTGEERGLNGVESKEDDKRTLILQEITHPCPTREHELRHVLHDLRFCFWRHRREPFREADFA